MANKFYQSLFDCVCFLGTDDNEGRTTYQGTAFWVSIPVKDSDLSFPYLVTARHCVERGQAASKFFGRLNNDAGGSGKFDAIGDWQFPDDPAVDLAIRQMLPPDGYKGRSMTPETFALPALLERDDVGVGDEVIVTGLFSQRFGQLQNLPILRSGIIASISDEPFVDDSGLEYQAILAEIRSIGGLSGSPVFVKYRMTDRKPMLQHCVGDEAWRLALLGVVRGHFDLHTRREITDSVSHESLNMGICLVTPVQALHDLLFCDEQRDYRKRILQAEMAQT